MRRFVFGFFLLQASCVFGQVNFEVFGNGGDLGILPEEEGDGWNGPVIRIAHDENGGVSNGVSWDNAVKGDYEKLEIDFEFRIWNEDEGGDADGLGFAYANVEIFEDEANEDEQFWGGGEEPNLEGSLGVGFDTWNNAALDDDAGLGHPDATLPNSFSLHYDGSRIESLYAEEYDVDDDWIQNQNVKRAHIEITPDNAGSSNVLVTVEDLTTGEVVTAFNEVVDGLEPYDGRVVFKARTGGEDSNHDVDNISVTHTPVGGAPTTFVHYGEHVGPSGGDPCDFDGDGTLGVGDIDAIAAEIQAGTNGAAFDLNGDSVVDAADLTAFVGGADKLNTWIGDSNLDGEFNSSDFVAVFGVGKFETGTAATWAEGDWNGDGVFGSGDFVAAFTDGGFEIGPKAAAAASVPEPSSIAILLIGASALLIRRRS